MNGKQGILGPLQHEAEELSVRVAGCGSAQAVHDRPSESVFGKSLDHQAVKAKPVETVQGGKQIGRRLKQVALSRQSLMVCIGVSCRNRPEAE